MPTECNPSASTPGRAPNPTAATKMMPMISSGTERRALSSVRAHWYTIGCGEVLRAARNASGNDRTTAMAVPAMLIANVSTRGFHQRCASVKSGGKESRASVRIAGTPFASVAKSRRLTYHAERGRRRAPCRPGKARAGAPDHTRPALHRGRGRQRR